MRLGIFGGTFNPVHYGHLLLAESCREQLSLDLVWFMPAAVPPHKQDLQLAPAPARLDMLSLAIGGQKSFQVCPYEVDRGGLSYTVDALEHFLAEDPTRELFFLMGSDSLRDLPTWRSPERICQIAVPVFVTRTIPAADDLSVDYSHLAGIAEPARLDFIRQHEVQMPRVDLSSTDIRQRVSAGRSIRYQTPRAVERYIETAGLYRG
jgi:nicotinate-nucleotide adenylyltransferase